MVEKPLRILNVLPALNYCGGIEHYAMAYYRHMNREHVQFDFITHTHLTADFEPEIMSYGGTVFKFPVFTVRHLTSLYHTIDYFFYEHHDYDAIHCHMANAAFLYFLLAKKYGIHVRILHSHQTRPADKMTHELRNIPLLYWGNRMATDRIACSREAGQFLFSDKPFTIIKDAIECERFFYRIKRRQELRKKYKLENRFVIGMVGRLTKQKNIMFLLSVFQQLVKLRPDSCLCIVGDGELRARLVHQSSFLGIDGNVIFMGTRADVNDIYNMFDVLAFPSLYEGVGIVAIEAQCNGLRVLASNQISPEAKISDLISFLPLVKQRWVEALVHMDSYERHSRVHEVLFHGYNIETAVKKMEFYYEQLLRHEKKEAL